MNIILVSSAQKAPRSFNLACAHTRHRAIAMIAILALMCACLGGLAALAIASPGARTLTQIQVLRTQLAQQRAQLSHVRGEAQRDLNGMAQKLGELQAQSIRLNALGERLAQAGNFDKDEFDFDQPPGMGGPEQGTGVATRMPQGLNHDIDALRRDFNRQQTQLEVLENLLMDRKVDSSIKPTGMPVNSGYIASYYGNRTDPFNGHSEFHSGLDIDAPLGSPVHAVAEGVVTYAGVRSGYGEVVEIDHGGGYMTRYAHNSKLLVHVGQRVRVGQVISKVGSTGRSTGPHVHFEVWLHGRTVNPLAYVHSHRG